MSGHVLHADRVQIIHSRTQADRLRGHRNARLTPLRRGGKGGVIHVDDLDHGPAGEEGWHRFEHWSAPPQDADAVRTEHFMARKGEQVDPELNDINRHVRH